MATAVFDELTLIEVAGSAPRRPRTWGFAINGRSLGELVALGDTTCAYGTADRAARRAWAAQLRGAAASALASGRVPIYVCSECGDLGCGAVTVRVAELDDCFAWSELGVETPWEYRPIRWHDERQERTFYFAKAAYLGTLT